MYLIYEKRNSFYYSELLKTNFNDFEPSDGVKLIIKNLLSLITKKSLWTILNSLWDMLYYSPLMIPYVMHHPFETSNGTI